MEAAEIIRSSVTAVSQLRAQTAASLPLRASVQQIKRFQAQRFRSTYSDLLDSSEYGSAAQFFLHELYSDKDFEQRDLQFSRIAGALQTIFPRPVVRTAVTLAELHRLTEELDHAMGVALMESSFRDTEEAYALAWREVGRQKDREFQLTSVLQVGNELERLTNTPGLRIMLKLMRKPAKAAGLSALQAFLERGFDTFGAMSGKHTRVANFLSTIGARESAFIEAMFSEDLAKRL